MKTFSDPQTTIEQERAKNATFIFKVEFWRQYGNPVTAVDAGSKTITVSGQTFINQGDYIFIPLNDFTATYQVVNIFYLLGSDQTTIEIDTDAFPSDIIGLDIAKRYVVSYGNTERMIEISPIAFSTEGETLNEFLAADVTFLLDNGDGFFKNKDAGGIFDNQDVFWVRIFTGYKNSSDRILYFGGIVDLPSISPDNSAKTIEVTAYSHEKELERYPGYLISEPLGKLLRLSGVELAAATAGSNTREGVKKLQYRFNTQMIQGVEILEIDRNTPSGVRSLRFRYPDKFRYHDGSWTTVAEDTAEQTLTDAGGLELKIKTTNYDIQDREAFLFIEGDVNAEIVKTGYGELVFDNGGEEALLSDFVAAYLYNGSSYSDESDHLDKLGDTFPAFAASGHILYLFTNRPFYGIEFDLDSTTLDAAIAIDFSNGYNSWQSLTGFTDGTSDLSQSGAITWPAGAVEGWRPISVEFSGVEDLYNKFAIRIKLSSHTTGSAVIDQIKKRIRLFASDDTILELKADQQKLPTEDAEEAVILRTINSVLTPCTWYKNLQDSILLDKILTTGNFAAADTDVDDLKVTEESAVINIWGQSPYPFYGKRTTAILYDSANARLWLGIENELWYHESGEFYLVGQLSPEKISIRRLAKDSSGKLQGAAWYDRYNEYDAETEDPVGLNFTTRFFRADTNGISDVASGDSDDIFPVEAFIRKGDPNAVFNTELGLIPGNTAGENIVVPFPQVYKRFLSATDNLGLFNAGGLLSSTIPTNPLIRFSAAKPKLSVAPGHYLVSNNAVSFEYDGFLDLRMQYGQAPFVTWDAGNDKWIVYQMDRNSAGGSDTAVKIVHYDYQGNLTQINNLSTSSKQPVSGCETSGDFYFGMAEWDDTINTESEFSINYMLLSAGLIVPLFETLSDSAEDNTQSIWGREAKMAVLEVSCPDGNTHVHGCMLDRDNFEYHYFVLKVGSPQKMYSTQTGSNFTFDKHRQIKNFVELDGDIYAVVVDTRYREESSYLIKAEFDTGSEEITLTRIDTIVEGDWDHQTLISDGTQLFGVTAKGTLWQYSTEFFPRTEMVTLEGMNLREAVTEIAKKINMIWTIRSNRKILFYHRDSYDGEKSLYEDIHIADLKPLEKYEHVYDGVEVSWKNFIEDSSGAEEYGTFGWQRNVLPVDGRFIQNRHIARIVANRYGSYFTTDRDLVPAELTSLIQMEERDRVKFLANSANYDMDRNTWWIINDIELDPETLLVQIRGVS